MRIENLVRVLALVLCAWGFAAGPAVAASSAHDHAAAPVKLRLDAGRKWATDAPLRKAMTNIRNAVDVVLPAIHTGKLTDAGYDALAENIHGEVNYMVSNCKLGPQADAQLHAIIVRMLEGATAMQGKPGGGTRQDGAVQVLDALADYNAYFDHPGWKPIQH